ncbi:hypothetical protein TNCV_2010961 [Trichonephila clavipes]|nr:hypothetical protein TNCV_2010961 [Trichonephila clavipes]
MMTMLRAKHMNHVYYIQVQMRTNEGNEGNICNGKTLPSNSLEPIHFTVLAVENSWFPRKQDAISNKIPLKIKMDRLKFKLEIVEALSASPPTNKSILIDNEDNRVL